MEKLNLELIKDCIQFTLDNLDGDIYDITEMLEQVSIIEEYEKNSIIM